VTASIIFRALDSLVRYKVVLCKSDLATNSAHLLVDQPPPFFDVAIEQNRIRSMHHAVDARTKSDHLLR
jgi:hypothetical protein